jgi:hypothetical protein
MAVAIFATIHFCNLSTAAYLVDSYFVLFFAITPTLSECCHEACNSLTYWPTYILLYALPQLMQAAGALDKYHVHAVVANLLHTRKDRVLVIQRPEGAGAGDSSSSSSSRSSSSVEVLEVLRPAQEPHIEKQLVERIVALHANFQQQQQQQ